MTNFRRGLGLLVLLLCIPAPVFAQWGYIGYARFTVDNTVGGVPFPAAQITDSSHMRPTQVFCSVETGPIRWTVDGTAPTTSVGKLEAANTDLTAISGTSLLSNFRAIRTTGTSGVLGCFFFAGASVPFSDWGSVTSTSGGGGAGDASAANQTTMINALGQIETAVEAMQTDMATANSLKRWISVGTTEDEFTVKTTAGVLAFAICRNSHATTDAYLKFTNLTIGNTTPGTSTVFFDLLIPAGASGNNVTPIEAAFDTALTGYIVTGKADADAVEVAANDVSCHVGYR